MVDLYMFASLFIINKFLLFELLLLIILLNELLTYHFISSLVHKEAKDEPFILIKPDYNKYILYVLTNVCFDLILIIRDLWNRHKD
jgi:hypothetical protein